MTTRTATLFCVLGVALATVETARAEGVEQHRFDIELHAIDDYSHLRSGVLAVPQFDASRCGRVLQQVKILVAYDSLMGFELTNRTDRDRMGRVYASVMVDLVAGGGGFHEGELVRYGGGARVPAYDHVRVWMGTRGSAWQFRDGDDLAPFSGDGVVDFDFEFGMLYWLADPERFDIDLFECACPIVFSVIVDYTYEMHCPADVDADAAVGLNDLLAVLDAWGECGACTEDVTCDGYVDFSDLVEVLTAWGPC